MAASICINEILCDDELRWVLSKLKSYREKDIFGLVCKRWLHLQNTERNKLSRRYGSHMVHKLASRFSRLLELNLITSFYSDDPDSDIAIITNGFRCLRVLNLHYCSVITDDGMASIGRGLPSLHSLDVPYCTSLTDKGLTAVAEGCHDMRSLDLSGCVFVTDGVLRALSKNCHNLEELFLQGCTKITDSGLADLGNGCRQINFLDINECSNVGDVGISSVSKACSSSLKSLIIGSRLDISGECIKSLLIMGILLLLS